MFNDFHMLTTVSVNEYQISNQQGLHELAVNITGQQQIEE